MNLRIRAPKRETLDWALDAILHSYSIILFTESRKLGAGILLASMLAPQFGLMGLAGAIIALLGAWALGFDKEEIRSGRYLFNSLLVCIALAYLYNFQKLEFNAIALLLISSSLLTLFMTVCLANMFYSQFALPCMSMPFVIVTFALFFMFFSFTGTPISSTPPFYIIPEPAGLPNALTCFFHSFGAILFLTNVWVGLVMVICLALYSRLALLFALVGYVSGVLFLQGFNYDITPDALAYVGFNFVFCAIALGGVFFVPSRSSLLLVIIGSFFCALIAIAVRTFLRYFGIPPLALPFNLVVFLTLYALRMRVDVKRLFCSPSPDASPERNFRTFHLNRIRFPDELLPTIRLPFLGKRTVTQAFDGDITHQGDWSKAFDFEAMNEEGNRFGSRQNDVSDYYTFDSPVLSPGYGSVVRVVSHIEDNPIGKSNLVDNWGNLVILYLDAGYYVKLCHLKQNSIKVQEGARVTRGQTIAVCGNSGRSPVPHLHVQVQHSNIVGASTEPFRLSRYITLDEGRKIFHTTGVPKENERIASVEFDDQVVECFDALVDKVVWFTVRKGDTESREAISCIATHTSSYLFHSPEMDASLTARIIDKVFFALDFQGSHDSLLFYVWLGMSRFPLTRETGVEWTDVIDSWPVMNPYARIAMELAGPFGNYPTLKLKAKTTEVQDRFVRYQPLVCVSTELDPPRNAESFVGGLPQKIDLFLARNKGIVGIQVESRSGPIVIERDREQESSS